MDPDFLILELMNKGEKRWNTSREWDRGESLKELIFQRRFYYEKTISRDEKCVTSEKRMEQLKTSKFL